MSHLLVLAEHDGASLTQVACIQHTTYEADVMALNPVQRLTEVERSPGDRSLCFQERNTTTNHWIHLHPNILH